MCIKYLILNLQGNKELLEEKRVKSSLKCVKSSKSCCKAESSFLNLKNNVINLF